MPSPLPRTKSRKHTQALQKLRCQGQGALAGVWRGSLEAGDTPPHPLADAPSFLHPREVNKRLQDLRSCLSPKQHQGQDPLSQDDEVVLVEGPVLPESPRLFPLKIRCRADLVRLPVRMVSARSACGGTGLRLRDPVLEPVLPSALRPPRSLWPRGPASLLCCLSLTLPSGTFPARSSRLHVSILRNVAWAPPPRAASPSLSPSLGRSECA